MKSLKKGIIWIAVLVLVSGMLASCVQPEETDSSPVHSSTEERSTAAPTESTTAKETTTAETTEAPTEAPTEPELTLYDLYRQAEEQSVSLGSEKVEVENRIECALKYSGRSFKASETQKVTHVFVDNGGSSLDYYGEVQTIVNKQGYQEPYDSEEYTLWTKDGIAYVQKGTIRQKTNDYSILGLDFLSKGLSGIHDQILHRLTPETVNSGELSEEGDLTIITVPASEGREMDYAVALFRTAHVFGLLFGQEPDKELDDSLMEGFELKEASYHIAIDDSGYFSTLEGHLVYRIPISKKDQLTMFGEVVAENTRIEVTIDRKEVCPEPGKEYSVELPEDAESYSDISEIPTGAVSFDELLDILYDGFLFTAEQVGCMTEEFRFACLYSCVPESAAALFEKGDFTEIAAVLNGKFFSAGGEGPVRYTCTAYQEYEITKETRESVQEWYLQNYDQVVQMYGEYYARKVMEENEGRERAIVMEYSTTDKNGIVTEKDEEMTTGLVFYVVNGKYYWAEFGRIPNQ